MPSKPLKPCNKPGCGAVTTERFCPAHQQWQDQQRPNAKQRGYTHRWVKYRAVFLKRYPLCVRCEADDRVTAATVVDHIIPHKGDQARFWDPDNHQALCKLCHDRKTAREDGAFGR